MRSPHLVASAALALASMAGSVGCTVSSPDQADAEAVSSTATAIVVVERTSGPGDRVTADGVVARFVRVRQGLVDDPALRIAGVAQSLPALGTCGVPSDPGLPAQLRAVDLLDVGAVSLASLDNAQAKSTILQPRSMPDPAGVVSGVFYSARSAEAFSPGEHLSLRANGGPDLLEGFTIGVTAPRDVGDVLATSSAVGLDVTWDAADQDVGDLVYVDVLSSAAHVLVRCSTLDTGHLAVPSALINNAGSGVDEGTVAVHRVHREGFRAKGIEPGEVRFDVARVVAFRR